MFEGEKNNVFWIGLLIFGLALFAFFTAIWSTISSYLTYVTYSNQPYSYNYPISMWLNVVPFIAGGAIFMTIGLYMMKNGVKKNPPAA